MKTSTERRINAYASIIRAKQKFITTVLKEISERFILEEEDITLQFVVGRVIDDKNYYFIDHPERLDNNELVSVVEDPSGVILANFSIKPALLNRTACQFEAVDSAEPKAFRLYTEDMKEDTETHIIIPLICLNRIWFDAVMNEENEEEIVDFAFFDFGVGSVEFYDGVNEDGTINYMTENEVMGTCTDVTPLTNVSTPGSSVLN